MFNTYVRNSQSSSGVIKYRDRDKTISRANHLRIRRGPFGLFRVVANFDFKPKQNASKVFFKNPLDLNQSSFDLKVDKINKKTGQVNFVADSTKSKIAPTKQTIDLNASSLPSDSFLDSLEGPSSVKQLRPKAISRKSLASQRRARVVKPATRILIR